MLFKRAPEVLEGAFLILNRALRVGLLMSCFLFSCTSFKEPQCTGVRDFKMKKIDMNGMSAEVVLGIKNPNNVGFSVYRSTFDVFYDGIYLGKARSHKRVHIKPNSEKDYSFTLNGSFKNVNLADVMRLVSGGGRGQLQVKGNIKAGKFFIRKKFPIDEKKRVGL
ncbi:MAG TPA: LEA type 2 family protein [Bacteroidia bacterium]|nr:LEA type 2 family protein [Bacteroidia bacterium]